jgi:hypothetical protein
MGQEGGQACVLAGWVFQDDLLGAKNDKMNLISKRDFHKNIEFPNGVKKWTAPSGELLQLKPNFQGS